MKTKETFKLRFTGPFVVVKVISDVFLYIRNSENELVAPFTINRIIKAHKRKEPLLQPVVPAQYHLRLLHTNLLLMLSLHNQLSLLFPPKTCCCVTKNWTSTILTKRSSQFTKELIHPKATTKEKSQSINCYLLFFSFSSCSNNGLFSRRHLLYNLIQQHYASPLTLYSVSQLLLLNYLFLI